MKTLGGSLFVHNAIEFDYCLEEAVKCLQQFCDFVSVVDAGSTDDTPKLLKSIADSKTSLLFIPNEVWEAEKGKEKLSVFSNMAHAMLGTDYFFNLQADEIVDENSYDAIRRAIETDAEAFLCTRINLWKDCHHKLNVPQHRKPCSTEVIRLAKKGYQSFDDAENLHAQAVYDFVDEIKIWHMGFVRKKEVMKPKIIHMQEKVFGMGHDKKLDSMDVFDWSGWFGEDDLEKITEPLPKIIRNWASVRP